MKPQTIRLFDVLVLGPAMIYTGWLLRKQHEVIASFIASSGVLTITYNWQNYKKAEQRELSQ